MKRTAIGALGLLVLSMIAAGLTWWIVGAPDRSVSCAEDDLKEGQVCLETILEEWKTDSYLWVDARPRKLWEKNGVQGSVLLTDDHEEDFDDLDADFMMKAFRDGEPYEKIIIYCNEEGCGSSEAIATHLRESYAEAMEFEVWVLYGGWKALAAEGLTKD